MCVPTPRINAQNTDLKASYAPKGRVCCTIVGVESLRALKVACDNKGLSAEQVADVFYGNAAKLFGLPV